MHFGAIYKSNSNHKYGARGHNKGVSGVWGQGQGTAHLTTVFSEFIVCFKDIYIYMGGLETGGTPSSLGALQLCREVVPLFALSPCAPFTLLLVFPVCPNSYFKEFSHLISCFYCSGTCTQAYVLQMSSSFCSLCIHRLSAHPSQDRSGSWRLYQAVQGMRLGYALDRMPSITRHTLPISLTACLWTWEESEVTPTVLPTVSPCYPMSVMLDYINRF